METEEETFVRRCMDCRKVYGCIVGQLTRNCISKDTKCQHYGNCEIIKKFQDDFTKNPATAKESHGWCDPCCKIRWDAYFEELRTSSSLRSQNPEAISSRG